MRTVTYHCFGHGLNSLQFSANPVNSDAPWANFVHGKGAIPTDRQWWLAAAVAELTHLTVPET